MERRKVTFNIATASCGFCDVYSEQTQADGISSAARKAVVYCKTCSKFLCSNCLKPHRKLVVTENHQILNRDHINLADDRRNTEDILITGRYSEMDKFAENALKEYEIYRSKIMKTLCKDTDTDVSLVSDDESTPTDSNEKGDQEYKFTEFCNQHPEELIKYFCGNHGKLCCEICKQKEHFACSSKVTFIPDTLGNEDSLALPFKKINSQIEEFKDYERKLHHDLKELKKSRDNFLHDLKNKKREILQWFNLMEVRAVRKVERVFDRCKQDIEKKRQKAKTACRDLRAEIYFLKEIAKSNMHDNIYKFIRMKRSSEFVDETAKKKEPRQFINSRFSLKMNEDFDRAHKEAEQLYELKFEKKGETKFNVRLKEDTHVCNVTGCVILTSGGLAITDRNNASVKVFNSQFKLIALVKIPDGVFDIDCLGYNSFAVTSPLKSKINLVDVLPVQEVAKVVHTGGGTCWGVKHHEGIFIVNCTAKDENYIRAVDLDSEILFQVETKSNFSSEIFIDDFTKQIKVITATCYMDCEKCETIHYVDKHRPNSGDNSFIVLEYNYLNHLNTKGVTTDDHNNIVVCCKDTDQIYTIAHVGNEAELLLAEPDGLHAPQALCYNQDRTKLLVTSENTDFVQIFEFGI
ncbi:hypothetical protein ACF0H5_005279 [Mactra antiquata]